MQVDLGRAPGTSGSPSCEARVPSGRHTRGGRGRGVRGTGWSALLVLVAVLLAGVPRGRSASEGPTEYVVKAALLEKILRYVEWSDAAFEDKQAELVICVVGSDPFGSVIDKAFRGKKHGRHPIRIVRAGSVEELPPCHVLFVPRAREGEQVLPPRDVEGQLAIGESEGFALQGGVINFYFDDSRIRFEINPKEAKRRDLKISSSLLKLARIVEEER